MTRLFAILIDGFSYGYLSEKNTPFLFSLSRSRPSPPLRPILGYSDAIRATIFSGTYPDRHNYWMSYRYSPETSPFGVFRRFGLLDHIPMPIKPLVKMALSRAMQVLLKRRCSIRNIPIKVANFFDYTTAKEITSPQALDGIPTLFDLLRDGGMGFTCIDSSKLGWRRFWVARSLRKPLYRLIAQIDPKTSLIYLYLHYLDNGAHRYGTRSPRFLRELRDVDSLVQQAVEQVEKTLGPTETMVFSDHGMVDAKAFISFEWMVKDPRLGKDYMVTLDSTMVRLWYLKEGAKDYVREKMKGLPYGHFLSEEEKRVLRVDFTNSLYGEDFYLIEPPYSIFPNFISILKPVAMHAYHPDLESQQGILLFRGEVLGGAVSERDYVRMVDIMPTMLKVLGLGIPDSCEGDSLI